MSEGNKPPEIPTVDTPKDSSELSKLLQRIAKLDWEQLAAVVVLLVGFGGVVWWFANHRIDQKLDEKNAQMATKEAELTIAGQRRESELLTKLQEAQIKLINAVSPAWSDANLPDLDKADADPQIKTLEDYFAAEDKFRKEKDSDTTLQMADFWEDHENQKFTFEGVASGVDPQPDGRIVLSLGLDDNEHGAMPCLFSSKDRKMLKKVFGHQKVKVTGVMTSRGVLAKCHLDSIGEFVRPAAIPLPTPSQAPRESWR